MRLHSLLIVGFAALTLAVVSAGTSHAQTLTTIYDFTSANSAPDFPFDHTLVQARDGDYYGTTSFGGPNGSGAVFRVDSDGFFGVVYSFLGTTDGLDPSGGLVQGADGDLYGSTLGTSSSSGTLYKVDLNGNFTLLHSFATGAGAANRLVQGSDGNFYGTTRYGGNAMYCTGSSGTTGCGSVFQMTPAGTYTDLYNFTGGTDGENPVTDLIQGSDGSFYGTTEYGGINDFGSIFKVTAAGAYSLVYSFDLGNTGALVESTVTEGVDGNFYGSTFGSGADNAGTIFDVSPSGGFNLLYTIPADSGQGYPGNAGIMLASDQNFYTAIQRGGVNAYGTLVKVTSGGAATVLHTFNFTPDGNDPSRLVQGSDGYFYGETFDGGTGGQGTLYQLAPASALSPPVKLSLSSSSVAADTPVTLSWQVLNAPSLTYRQCYAFVQNNVAGAGMWTGQQTGTYSSTTHVYSGSATVTPTANGIYTYALTCGGTESGFATLTVAAPKPASTTTVTSTPSPLTAGQTVTLKATVGGSSGTPTGSAVFSFEGNTLATVNLVSGVGSFPVSTNGLPPGTYPIVATYSGSSTYSASTSAAHNVVIGAAPTATTLVASPNPDTPPAAITFTATVKRSTAGAAGTPTGNVTFYFSTNALSTGKLNASGVATYTVGTSGFPAGSYPITARYTGDTSDATSTGAVTAVVK